MGATPQEARDLYFNPRVIVCKRSSRNNCTHGVHQGTSVYPLVREMRKQDQKPGTDGYRLCDECIKLNNQGR